MGGSGAQFVGSIPERRVRVTDLKRAAVVLDPHGGAIPHTASLGGVGPRAELVEKVGGDFDMAGAQDLALRASEDLVAYGGQAGEILGVIDRPAVALHARSYLVHPLGGLPDRYLCVAFDCLSLCEFAAVVAAGPAATVQVGLDMGAALRGRGGGLLGVGEALLGVGEVAL
jgi:hypothetical protein